MRNDGCRLFLLWRGHAFVRLPTKHGRRSAMGRQWCRRNVPAAGRRHGRQRRQRLTLHHRWAITRPPARPQIHPDVYESRATQKPVYSSTHVPPCVVAWSDQSAPAANIITTIERSADAVGTSVDISPTLLRLAGVTPEIQGQRDPQLLGLDVAEVVTNPANLHGSQFRDPSRLGFLEHPGSVARHHFGPHCQPQLDWRVQFVLDQFRGATAARLYG